MIIKEAVTATPWSADNSFDRDNAEQHVSLYDYEFDSQELVNNVETPSEITDFDNFINQAMPTDAEASGSNDNIIEILLRMRINFLLLCKNFCVDEHVGNKVNSAVAESVNTMFFKRLNEESLSSTAKCIHRPENCQKLVVPFQVSVVIYYKFQTYLIYRA